MMYVIFVFSSQEASVSSDISQRVSVVIVKTTDYVFDLELDDWKINEYAWRINGVTRKLAHMTEYFLLAISVSFPLYVYGLHGILLVLVAGIICVGYACSDEYHQAFVAGRAASMKDVGIDSTGILLGIILVRIIGWTGRHTIFRPLPQDRQGKMTRRELKKLRKQQDRLQRQFEKQKQQSQQSREKTHYDPDYDKPGQARYNNKEETPHRRDQRQGDIPRGYERYDRSDRDNDEYGYDRYGEAGEPYGYGPYGRDGRPYGYDAYGRSDEPYGYNAYGRDDEPYGYDSYGRNDGPDRYDSYGRDDEPAADDLSEDMPLSGLFRKNNDR